MPEASITAAPPPLAQPEAIFNCPNCSHWLPEATLACPDCQTIVYSAHLRDIALAATTEESEKKWLAARDTWRSALPWLPPGTKQHVAVQQRIDLIDTRLRAEDDTKAKWTRRLGPLAPAVFFLAKLKWLFLLLTKAKFFLSFAGFFLLYWAFFGWKFGLGFAVGILIHEMGHYVTARRRGLKVDLPVFLPGLGAYVRWYSQGVSLDDLSSIALAGPFFGLLIACVYGTTAVLLHDPFYRSLFMALAHVIAWLNLMNLIPVFGLDGAQATYALNRTQRWLIVATALIFFGLLHEWMFLLIAGGMAYRLYVGGYADQPSTRTMVKFVLLLFALGVLIAIFPDTTRNHRF